MIRGRDAQRFHELIETTSTGGTAASEYGDLLAVVGALRAVDAPAPDPDFVARLRDRLVAEAEEVLAAAAARTEETDARLRLPARASGRTRPGVRRRRRLAALAAGVALAGSTATVAVAAQSALPGDGLYPVKRGLESARVELTFDRAARGRLLLHDASVRLDEVQQLSRDGSGAARVSQALDAFTQQTVQGADLLVADYRATGHPTSIAALRAFTAGSMDRLRMLQSEVPALSLDSLLQAAQTLDQVQSTAVHTCPTCSGPSIGSVPAVLAQATAATVDAWPSAGAAGAGHGVPQRVADAGPQLPQLPSRLPPASVTDPSTSTAAAGDTSQPTAGQLSQTVSDLTSGLTSKHQKDLSSTVTDTASNLLDAVGQVGDQVAGALDQTVGGIQSLLPTAP